MAKSIKLGSDTYLDWSGIAVAQEDITVTTGSTQYHGMYYGEGTFTKATREKCISLIIVDATSNRPVFVEWTTTNSVRVFTPTTMSDGTRATIRAYYKLP